MKRYSFKKRTLFACLVLQMVVLALAARPVSAHGSSDGTIQLDAVPVGNYRLTVWTSMIAPQTGEVHFVAAVVNASDGLPLLDRQVLFRLSPLEGTGTEQAIQALRTARLYEYEAVIIVPMEGRYRVEAVITDPRGAEERIGFDATLQAPAGWMKWLVIAMLIQALIVALWFLKEGLMVWGFRPRSPLRSINRARRPLRKRDSLGRSLTHSR